MSAITSSPADPNDQPRQQHDALPLTNPDLQQQCDSPEPTCSDIPVVADVVSDSTVATPLDVTEAPNRFFLPSRKYRIIWSAQRLFRALAAKFAMFVHAGVVVELAFTGKDRAELREVTAAMARSRFEL